jgi:PAS domain S-box-containing protein
VETCFEPGSWAQLNQSVKTCIASGTAYQVDAEVITPGGDRRWITARGEAVRDSHDHIIALRGTLQDITQRKQTEVALAKSEESFRLAMEATDDGLWD